MKTKEYPSQELLKKLYNYKDGFLIRKSDGLYMGKLTPQNYTIVYMGGENYFTHRLVWIWYNGDIPEGLQIDHISRIRYNNKIKNLRIVTNQENSFNTGAKGYQFDAFTMKWVAKIVVNGATAYLGSYDTEEKAKAIYNQAKAEILDTLRHYRETGEILKNELISLVVLEDTN